MEQRKFGHEDSQFVTEVGHNKFLEREEEYRKMNEELEKKTAMLFAKMDKYWVQITFQYLLKYFLSLFSPIILTLCYVEI